MWGKRLSFSSIPRRFQIPLRVFVANSFSRCACTYRRPNPSLPSAGLAWSSYYSKGNMREMSLCFCHLMDSNPKVSDFDTQAHLQGPRLSSLPSRGLAKWVNRIHSLSFSVFCLAFAMPRFFSRCPLFPISTYHTWIIIWQWNRENPCDQRGFPHSPTFVFFDSSLKTINFFKKYAWIQG